MDDRTLLEKIFQISAVAIGSLISFFFYRQKKMNDEMDVVHEKVHQLEISQAEYNKSVDFLVDRFTRIEKSNDVLSDKIDKLYARKGDEE